MKISLMCVNLSSNALGRSHLLANVLKRFYDVEIIGPVLGDTLWEPVAHDNTIPVKSLKIDSGLISPYQKLLGLTRMIDGDVIYVQKPLLSALGPSLLEKWRSNKPCILDIDDWQLGLINHEGKWSRSHMSFYNTYSYWNALLCERLVRYADAVTVSSSFLQEKFGGVIVRHGRDTTQIDPAHYERNAIRSLYGIAPAKKVVLFAGMPRPHKGIDNLIDAVHRLPDPDLVLCIAGMDKKDPFGQTLYSYARSLLGNRFRNLGPFPLEDVPKLLTLGDVVVIPQKDSDASVGQIPAKLFDAMAMAKPIVSTHVSDIPDILNDCGWIVPPSDPERLSEAIQAALSDPKEAMERGKEARQRCVSYYSWEAMAAILKPLFTPYENGGVR